MKNFTFDLQRFAETITVDSSAGGSHTFTTSSGATDTVSFYIGNNTTASYSLIISGTTEVSVDSSGNISQINVVSGSAGNLTSNSAAVGSVAVSLASAGTSYDNYTLQSAGTTGLGVTLSGGSNYTLGDIDNGDVFLVGGSQYADTNGALWAGTSTAYNKVRGETVTLSSGDATGSSAWYSILPVGSDSVINITNANNFSAAGYTGVVAADTTNAVSYATLGTNRNITLSSTNKPAHVVLSDSFSGSGVSFNDAANISIGTSTNQAFSFGNSSFSLSISGAEASVSGNNGNNVTLMGAVGGTLYASTLQNVYLGDTGVNVSVGANNTLGSVRPHALINSDGNNGWQLLLASNSHTGENNYNSYKISNIEIGARHNNSSSVMNVNASVDSQGITSIVLNPYGSVPSNYISYNSTGYYSHIDNDKSLRFIFGKETSGNVSVSGLGDGDLFRTKNNSVDSYYRMLSSNVLVLANNNATDASINGSGAKYYTESLSSTTTLSMGDINYSTSTLLGYGHTISSANGLSISNNLTNTYSLDANSHLSNKLVVLSSDGKTRYGTLTKTTNGWQLRNIGSTKLTSITSAADLTVEIDDDYAGTPINISNVANFTTSSVKSGLEYFTISSADNMASVDGALGISLTSGTLKTDSTGADAQTITVGTASVISGYSVSGDNGDGLIIARSGNNVTLGDIDDGESFTFGGVTYTKSDFGLMSSGKIFTGQTVNGGGTGGIGVVLNSLEENMAALIVPDSQGLDIGTTNTVHSVVVNDSVTPTVKYAELLVNGSEYTLSTIGGDSVGTFTAAVNKVSITGGDTTIYRSLTNNTTTIVGGQKASLTVAEGNDTFKVSNATVSSTNLAISGATSLNLLGGTIGADNTQTVNSGGKDFHVKSTPAMTVDYTSSKTNINASSLDNFTYDGKDYSVVSGDGMTVSGDSSDVTINGLTYNGNDIFVYDGAKYSAASIGFFKYADSTVANPVGIWSPNNHSLSNASVTTSSLSQSDSWENLIFINNSSLKVPADNSTLPAVLVNDALTNIFGSLQGSNSTYTLAGGGTDTLSNVSIDSSVNALSLGSGLTSVTISAPNSTFIVTDDGNDGYQVTLDNSVTSLDGAAKANLIGGSLTADKNLNVSVGGYTVNAGDNSTVVVAEGNTNPSIGGVDANEVFSVSGGNYTGSYTLSSAGLASNSKLLRGSKDNSVFALGSLATNGGDWLGMVAASTLTIGSSITDNVFVVNDVNNPVSLHAELTTVASGYSLKSATDGWGNDTIKFKDTIVSLASDFKDKNFEGISSNAAFKVDSLSGNSFAVTDSTSGGASLSGVNAITQTAGLIAPTGLKTIVAGSANSIIANSGGLELSVSVNGSEVTLSDFDETESFTVNGTENYTVSSISSALGFITDDKLWTDNAINKTDNITLAKLRADSSWSYITVVENNALVIPPTPTGANSWVVLNSARNTKYGAIDTISGGYYLSKGTNDAAFTGKAINISDTTLSLSSDFANTTINGSGATLNVSIPTDYTVKDSASGASVNGASANITLSAGVLTVSDSTQSILAGKDISSVNGEITISLTGGSASVGGLEGNESFTFDGTNYTLLSNGRFERTDGKIWNGDTVATTNGSIALDDLTVASSWYNLLTTDGNFTINNSNVSSVTAFLADSTDTVKIYGTFESISGGSGYGLSTLGSTNDVTIKSVTITDSVQPVSLTSDFVNVSINAYGNGFMSTDTVNGFVVNYDSSMLRVDNTTALTLTDGILKLGDNNQTVTAGGQTVQKSNGDITITYNETAGLLVESIDEVNDAVKINGATYTLLNSLGGGLSVSVKGGTTTIENLTKNDDFQIAESDGTITFHYTSAGLTKTDKNSDVIEYVLKDVNPANNKLALTDLQSTGDIWLGISAVSTLGNITISSGLTKSVVLVDSINPPSLYYGSVEKDSAGNIYTLDWNVDLTQEAFKNFKPGTPTGITVIGGAGDNSVKATIADANFTTLPVTAIDANEIDVVDSTNASHTISGTVDKFIPSTMVFTPDSVSGDKFTVDGTGYEMTGAGLTTGNKLWTEAGVSDYTLPAASDSLWSNFIKTTDENSVEVLNFNNVTIEADSNVVTDSKTSERLATLNRATGTTNDYTLKFLQGKEISKVHLADGTVSLATDKTTVETDNGTYTINGRTYNGASLTVYATSTTSALYNGTVTLFKGDSVTPNDSAHKTISIANADSINATDSITATAADGKWVSLGGLTDGDIFTIDTATYKVFGDNTLVKMDGSAIGKLFNDSISANHTLSYDSIVSDNYSSLISLDTNGQLNLTSPIDDAIVVEQTTAGEFDPTKRVAELSYAGGTYELKTTDGGDISKLTAVSLSGAANNFKTELTETVKTASSGTFTVNSKTFVAQDVLTIETSANNAAFLINGTVTLDKDNYSTVTTRYNNGTNVDETITATEGSLEVTADNLNSVTINDLNAGEKFNVGTDSYTMTGIGLLNAANKINATVSTSVKTSELSGSAWKDILLAKDGVVTIKSDVGTNVLVADVDFDNPSADAFNYGNLTKTANKTYTFEPNGTLKLKGVVLDNAIVTFPSSYSGIPISKGTTSFTVTATDKFTVDAQDTPEITGASAITLSSGTLTAPSGVVVTASGNAITSDVGEMTIAVEGTTVTVGALNENDEFTVGTTKYKMTSAGLLDEANKRIISGYSTEYVLGTAFSDIIAVDENKNLDLSKQAKNALVYDSLTAPKTQLATLTVENGALTLTKVADGIETINVADGANLTAQFAAQVTGDGLLTVNNAAYNGSDLVIDTSSDGSTLYSGTITLDDTNKSAQATNDSKPLSISNGALKATAAAGTFTKLEEIDAADIFSVNGTQYTQSNIGLLTGNSINSGISDTVEVSKLGEGWQTLWATSSGALKISNEIGTNYLAAEVVEDKTACTEYGTLTRSGNAVTFEKSGAGTINSVEITGKLVTTLAKECSGKEITTDGAKFTVTATDKFVVDATDTAEISGASAITLSSGTLTAPSGIVVTASGNAITSDVGEMTIAVDGTTVTVGALNENDEFTVGTTKYKMTSAGLLDEANKRIISGYSTEYVLGTAFSDIIAVDENKNLDLSKQSKNALVYDSLTNPKTQLATLTVENGALTLTKVADGIETINVADGANLTAQFAAQVTGDGLLTVNNAAYNGSDLVIDTSSDGSTLYSGTITLDDTNKSAQATNDSKPLSISNGALKATAAAGTFTKLEEIGAADIFSVNGTQYTQSNIGLLTGNSINSGISDTVEVSKLGEGWQTLWATSSGALKISNEIGTNYLAAEVVEDKTACTEYGTLTRSGNAVTFEKSGAGTINSVEITGKLVTTLAKECSGKEITTDGAKFTVTATDKFVVDATDTAEISGASAITLSSGTLTAPSGIVVTASGNAITSDVGEMTIAVDGTTVTIGALNENDEFTVGTTKYKMTSAGLLDEANKRIISGYATEYVLGTAFSDIIAVDENKNLDLSKQSKNALVYDSLTNPKTQLATLTVENGALTLTKVADGIETISVADGANLTAQFAAQVTGDGLLTVNNAAYNGSDLVIDTSSDGSTLYSGTITLDDTNKSAQATNDSKPLSISNGALKAMAAAGTFTKLEEIGAADIFSVNGTQYTQSNIGLLTGNSINSGISDTVEVSKLGEGWQTLWATSSGALKISNEIGTNYLAAEVVEDKTACTEYGTLTRSGNAVTFEKSGAGTINSVEITGKLVTTLAKECSGKEITTDGAKFTVTATDKFVVDATDTAEISGASAITLSSGTLTAPSGIVVTASGNAITSDVGEMTIAVEGTTVTVGALNENDEFTVGTTKYKMTSAGLLDEANKRIISGYSTEYVLGTGFSDIIAVDENKNLDLSKQSKNALVYDSLTNPKTQLATLEVENGALTLTKVADGIETINVADGANLTAEFAAQVTGNGLLTVNNAAYNGSDLVIDTSSDGSTLYSGTITLDDTNKSAQATNDSKPLIISNGALKATAAAGTFTKLEEIDAADIFSVNGTQYTQSNIGLLTGNSINSGISDTVEVSKLGEGWQTLWATSSGALKISNEIGTNYLAAEVVEDKTACTEYGTLTRSGNAVTFEKSGAGTINSVEITGKLVTTLAKECSGKEITTDGAKFTVTATDKFVVDATDTAEISGASAITLTSGTLKAPSGIVVTASGNAITSDVGEMTIAVDGTTVTIGALNENDEFTVGTTKYKMTSAGLLDEANKRIISGYSTEYVLGTAFSDIIAVDENKNLDLSKQSKNALVYDSLTNPKTQLATLTVENGALTLTKVADGIETINVADGANLTAQFAAQVTGDGLLTVNNAAYNGSDLVIDTSSDGSTLYSGTITLDDTNKSAQATNDSKPLSISNGALKAMAAAGTFTKLEEIGAADIFSVNGTQYTQSNIGLLTGNSINSGISDTVEVSKLGEGWQTLWATSSGALKISNEIGTNYLAAEVVEDKTACTEYGTLTRSGNAVTFEKSGAGTINSVEITGKLVTTLAKECSGKEITTDGAKFTVTATDKFVVDAQDTPEISGASAITLTSGTLKAPSGIVVTASGNAITSDVGEMTIAVEGTTVTVGALNENDEFTVGTTKYKMTSAGLLDEANKRIISGYSTEYVLGTGFSDIIAVDENKNLDLSKQSKNALVYDSLTNPKTQLATLTVENGALTLTKVADGIETINVADGANLTAQFAAQVTGDGLLTVNNAAYNGSDLVIDTSSDGSTLYSGTITLDDTNKSAQATNDSKPLSISNGALKATAAAGTFTKLEEIDAADIFSVNGTQYTQSNIGLLTGNSINSGISDTVEVSKLGEGWQTLWATSSGALKISNEIGTNYLAAEVVEDKTACTEYGTLTRSGNEVTFEKSGAGTINSVEITGKLVTTLAKECSGKEITTDGAKFTVTATDKFVVDATDTAEISGASAITLTSGTLKAPSGIVVTASGNAITSDVGEMTIAVDGTTVTIGALNENDEFTVGTTKYKMTSAGLLDEANKRIISGYATKYVLGTAFSDIIAVDENKNLDLSKQNKNALVYDSLTNPKTQLATLEVENGALTLTKVADGIETISVADGANLTAQFAAQVTGDGLLTVNNAAYNGSDLVIYTTADSSTLYSGTITLDNANSSAKATNDSSELSVVNGTLTAIAENGKFKTIENLDEEDSFTYNETTYTQSIVGLVTGSTIREDLVSTTLELGNLNSVKWSNFIAQTDGVLDISKVTDDVLVFDDATIPTSKLATLTIKNDKITLKGEDDATTIETINVAKDSTVDVDFVTQVSAPKGSVTVNGKTYNGSTKLVIDSDGTTSTLYQGTVVLDTDNPSVTASNSSTLTIENGTINAVASKGVLTTISDLDNQESFTYNGNTYTQSEVGLMLGDTLSEKLTGKTIKISDLNSVTWSNIIVPDGDTLDLTNVTESAIICNDADNPTEKFATLTVVNGKMTLKDNGNAVDAIKTVNVADAANLTADFVTQISAPSGSVIVNNKTYKGTTELVIDSDGTTSTLNSGTVSLDKGDSVTMTSGSKITNTDGDDGIIASADGDNVIIDDMTNGDSFKVNDDDYKVTAVGLMNKAGKFWTSDADYTEGLTITALADENNWTKIFVADNGALSVDPNSLSDGEETIVIDDADNPTKIFGKLTKTDGDYFLVKDDDDDTLNSITVDTTRINVDSDLSAVPIKTILSDGTESEFKVTPSHGADDFLVDATGAAPKTSDVSSVEISKGKVQISEDQTYTLTDDAEDVRIVTGNGRYKVGDETFTVNGLKDDNTVEFELDENGKAVAVDDVEKDASVIIDGKTYTSPADGTRIIFTEDDGWIFDNYEFESYTVTIDASGNITVDIGARFADVLAGDRTLASDGNIQLAADVNYTPVTFINKGRTPLNITDARGNSLVENLDTTIGVKFDEDGVMAVSLSDVAGAIFTLQNGQAIETDNATITAYAADTQIGIGEGAASLSSDKDATFEVPADINLTLNAGDYTVNGATFTASGTTSAITTSKGVQLDLETSAALTNGNMTLDGTGTAIIDKSNGVTLSGGATATNASDRVLTINDTAVLDDKTINAATPTKLRAEDDGIIIGDEELIVTGDVNGYEINIEDGKVIGLDSIGSDDGVQVIGLDNATIKTDVTSSLTAGGKTINAPGNVTYTVEDGELVSVDDVAGTVSGDLDKDLIINGDQINVVSDKEAAVSVVADSSGVTKVETNEEDIITVNGKTYEIQDDNSFAFDMNEGIATGVDSLESGNLIISQEENNFKVNDETITITGNEIPVSLTIEDSKIISVNGINDGTISGLDNATVYGLNAAMVNETLLDIIGSEFNAVVTNGTTSDVNGVMNGATISSAPEMKVTTAENGTFIFGADNFNVVDTADESVDFITDENSHVKAIENFTGSISGPLDGVTINGKSISVVGDNVTVESDGENITNISGLQNGNEISGDLKDMHLVIEDGEVTINGTGFKLEGDDNGVVVTDNGADVTDLDKDATLTVEEGGTYTINDKTFTLEDGDALTVNRDGIYVTNPDDPPISEKTEPEDILARSDTTNYIEADETGEQVIDLTESDENTLVLVDSSAADSSVKTSDGNDTIVVRHGADVAVDLNEEGETLIIPTAGNVTLENYDGDNAAVQTFDYLNLINAVKTNEIKFGDGVMTVGDAVVTFDPAAGEIGSVSSNLYNALGDRQKVAFTNTAGGEIDMSDEEDPILIKGNYAENTGDTQKSSGSTIVGGSGNDTILAGAGDSVDGGAGKNQIYLTDSRLRRNGLDGATIVLSENTADTVRHFASGFDDSNDKIFVSDMSELVFDYGASRLIIDSGQGSIAFNNLDESDSSYNIKISDGDNNYNAAVAKSGKLLTVDDNNSAADIFYGNERGISFSEYTGSVEVNLNDGTSNLDGSTAQLYGIDRAVGGAGDSSLNGAANKKNTLVAGTGNTRIWSNTGNDLMVGNTSSDKTGSTEFYFLADDGRDTITNLDFMNDAYDSNADYVKLPGSNVTDVHLNGNDVVIGINNSANDYLTIAEARGKSFHFNDDIIAKVDSNISYDGFTNCYAGVGDYATLTIGKGYGDVEVWLSDDTLGKHSGIMCYGNIGVMDASLADGFSSLAGNDLNNLIIGGSGENSMWGGDSNSNDTLVGGSGYNMFYYEHGNGEDVIQNAHDGDLVWLGNVRLEQIARADITDTGILAEFTDGSKLTVESKAAVNYQLEDGTTYTADFTNKVWNKK